MNETPPDSGDSGNSGGGRPGGGRGRKRGSSGSGRPPGQGGRGPQGRPPSSGRGRGPGGGNQQSPLEVGAKTTRNALRRHAESVRDEQSKLACRSVLIAIGGATRGASSPAETITVIEQVSHVLEAGRKEEAQLPVVVRAAVAFSGETPRRQKDVAEMLRLVLRHVYALAADHIPRQLRDDGGFRASALGEVMHDIAVEYLDEAAFQKLAR